MGKKEQHVMVDDSQLSTASTLNGSVCGTCTTVSSPGCGDDCDDEIIRVSTKENVNIDIDMHMNEDKKDENEDEDENDIVPIVLWKIDERLDGQININIAGNTNPVSTITGNTSLSKLDRLRARTKILRKQGKQIIAETRGSIRKNRTGLVVSDDRDPIASDDTKTDFPPRIIESSKLSDSSRYSPSLPPPPPPPPMSPPSPLRVSSSLLQPPNIVVRPDTAIEEGSSSAVAGVAAASHRKHHRRLRKQQPPSSPCFSMYNKNQKCQKLQVENDCLKRQLNVLESRNRVTERKLTKKLRYQNNKVSKEDKDNYDDDTLVDDDEILTSSLSNDSNKEKEGRHHRLKHHRRRRKNTPSKGSLSYRRKIRKKKRRRVVMVCIVAPLFVSLTLWFYQSVRKTSSSSSSSSYYMNTNNIIENKTTTAAINTKNVEGHGSFSRLIGNMSSLLIGNDNENNNNIGSVLTSTASASTTTPFRDNLALVMREGILRQILFHDNKSYDIKNDNSEGSNIYSNDDADDDTDNNSNNSNELLFMTENEYCPAIEQHQIQQSHDKTYSTSREDENNPYDRNDKEAAVLEKKELEKKMKDERLEKERIEAECIKRERKRQRQRQDAERLELERIDMEQQQQIDRLEKEREHQEKERFELERRIKQEQQEKERIELERIASEKHERLVKVRLEREELEHIKQREEDSMHERLVKARLEREELERIEQIRTELEEKRNSEEEKERAEEKRRELEEERVHILGLEREVMHRIMELEEEEYRLFEVARERARALVEQEERTELTRLEAIAMEEKEMHRTLEVQREKEESLATRKEEQKTRQEAEEKALLVGIQRNQNKSYFLNRINNGLKRLKVGSIVQYQIQQSNVSSTSREIGNNNNDRNDEEVEGTNFQHNNNKKGNRLKRMFSNLKIRSRIDNGLKRVLKKISIRQDHNTLGVWLVNRNDGEAAGSDFERNDYKKANRLKNLRIRSRIDSGFKQILNKIRVRQDHNTLEVWLEKRFKRLKRIVVKEKTV